MAAEPHTPLFSPARQSTLARRLVAATGDAAGELASGPASYLKSAFFSGGFADWLPVRLIRNLGSTLAEFFAHPVRFISSSFPPDWIIVLAADDSILASGRFVKGIFFAGAVASEGKRAMPRRRFRPVLAASAALHSALIILLLYVAFLSQFADLRIVNEAYRQLDVTKILGPLHYPPGMLRRQPTGPLLSIEEIRERDRKRREERLQREKAEHEKQERERAEREADEKEKQALAEDAGKKETEADKDANTKQFGAINEAPIVDIIRKVYAIYKDGNLDIQTLNFSVMATFKIERDGSLSNIKLIKSSGSKIIDENAVAILWQIGESHALRPISDLTSNSIRLDLTEDMTRLTITSFASSPKVAKEKAELLNSLFWLMRLAQKNSVTAELVSLIKVTSSNNRVDADMTISRQRADQMMRAKFGSGK
jgi:hypothetical protein